MMTRVLTTAFLLACLGLPFLNAKTAGSSMAATVQCSDCIWEGGCFFCGGSFGGGESCLAWCDMCTLWGTCDLAGIRTDDSTTATASPKTPGRTLRAKPNTIRDIAEADPHFALAILRLSQIPLIRTSGRLFLTPLQMSAEDIGDMLDSGQRDTKSFAKWNAEVHRVNQLIQNGEASALVYSIHLTDLSDTSATLRLRLESGSAEAGKTLSMNIVPLKDSTGTTPLWKLQSWRVE